MDESNWDSIKDGECVKQSTVYRKDDKGQSKKTVRTNKVIDNGKVKETKTEEYTYPNGTKQITQTVNEDGKLNSRTWNLNKG